MLDRTEEGNNLLLEWDFKDNPCIYAQFRNDSETYMGL